MTKLREVSLKARSDKAQFSVPEFLFQVKSHLLTPQIVEQNLQVTFKDCSQPCKSPESDSPRVEEGNDLGNSSDSTDSNSVNEVQERRIGQLTLTERVNRIVKYKTKVIKRRNQVPITKRFDGRSSAATNKVRVNGKFVRKEF
jgi:hypothetical protein